MNRLDNHQPLGDQKISFEGSHEISQLFTSNYQNLNAVSICIRNPSRLLTPIKFELKDVQGTVLRTIDFTGGNIDNSDCTRFQFDPVGDSGNQDYLASLTLQIDDDLAIPEQQALKSGLYIEAHAGTDYLAGNAYQAGLELPYDLHFKTFYRQETKAVISESATQFQARLFADPVFFVSLLGIFLYLLWKYRQAI